MSSGIWAGTIAIDTICKADLEDGTPCPWMGIADVDVDPESGRYSFTCGNGHDNQGDNDHIIEPCS
jgi:hypothetical protein